MQAQEREREREKGREKRSGYYLINMVFCAMQ
jgi:hypothetical protein